MTATLQQFPVIVSQNIIWGDMDAYGHVNNTVYLRYFEDVRMAYFDAIGVSEHKQQLNVGPIMANVNCNFRLPLRYPDKIQIATRGVLLSAKKLNMEFVVYSEGSDWVVADGEGLVLFYDYSLGKSCAIPEPIVSAMDRLEGRAPVIC